MTFNNQSLNLSLPLSFSLPLSLPPCKVVAQTMYLGEILLDVSLSFLLSLGGSDSAEWIDSTDPASRCCCSRPLAGSDSTDRTDSTDPTSRCCCSCCRSSWLCFAVCISMRDEKSEEEGEGEGLLLRSPPWPLLSCPGRVRNPSSWGL